MKNKKWSEKERNLINLATELDSPSLAKLLPGRTANAIRKMRAKQNR
jgi:hypothetical protein